MKKLLPFIILIFAVLGCNNKQPEYYSNIPATPAAAIDEKKDFQRQALSVVGADDGWQRPADEDVRVRKTRILLKTLSELSSETPFDIAFALDSTASDLEKIYRRKITRQQLLEDAITLYSDEKTKANAKQSPFKDSIKLYAILKYGK